jgi:hypothetical protein
MVQALALFVRIFVLHFLFWVVIFSFVFPQQNFKKVKESHVMMGMYRFAYASGYL